MGEDKITFKIKKPQHDQSGNYQIKIGNAQGEEVQDVFVNMQGNHRRFAYITHFFKIDVIYLQNYLQNILI